MTRLPSTVEQVHLLERLLRGAELTPNAQNVLRVLFQETIEAAIEKRPAEKMSGRRIMQKCHALIPPDSEISTSEGSVNNALSELRMLLPKYFEKQAVSEELFEVEIENRTHILRFIRRQNLSPNVREFWEPYFISFSPASLFYPEPQFFRHHSGAYIRHPAVNWWDQREDVAKRLKLDKEDLTRSYSFIASGMTSAMARLFESFHEHDSYLHAQALKRSVEDAPWNQDKVVVLGSPTTSMELIENIEKSCPIKTCRKGEKTSFSWAAKSKTKKPSKKVWSDGNEEETNADQDKIFVTKVCTHHSKKTATIFTA